MRTRLHKRRRLVSVMCTVRKVGDRVRMWTSTDFSLRFPKLVLTFLLFSAPRWPHSIRIVGSGKVSCFCMHPVFLPPPVPSFFVKHVHLKKVAGFFFVVQKNFF